MRLKIDFDKKEVKIIKSKDEIKSKYHNYKVENGEVCFTIQLTGSVVKEIDLEQFIKF